VELLHVIELDLRTHPGIIAPLTGTHFQVSHINSVHLMGWLH